MYLKIIYNYEEQPITHIEEVKNGIEIKEITGKYDEIEKKFTKRIFRPVKERYKDAAERIKKHISFKYIIVSKGKNGKGYFITPRTDCYLLDGEGQTIEKIS